MTEAGADPRRARWARVYAVMAPAALVLLLAVRIAGPSDAWNQTQQTTIAYTIDILVHGHWVLPVERETVPATKPPLYNWIAAPAVALAGYSSELAHKLPSVAALVLCFGLTVAVGRRVIPGGRAWGGGWLAGLIFTSSYTTFKLGYLARPDMLLVLWMFAGWAAVTAVLADTVAGDASAGRRRWLVATFWLCVGLAALTKGPAMLPLLFYAILAPRLLAGRWGAGRVLGWWWGAPASMLGIGAWLFAVWRIAPEHLVGELWSHQVVGQVTGIGPSPREPIALITTAPNMVFYYLTRFEPWCVFATLATARLWTRQSPGGPRRWRSLGAQGAMLHGAAIFVVVMIATYTLVASKRADYLAPAYPASAMLAAWWLLRGPSWHRPLAAACAAAVLAGVTINNALEPAAPYRGFGSTIRNFVRDVDRHVAADPAPIVCWVSGFTHMESFLGYTGPTDENAVREAAARGRPFWLVVGRWGPMTPRQRLDYYDIDVDITEACRSRLVPYSRFWPLEVMLFKARPRQPAPGAGPPPDPPDRS